jgi:uncharacterized protein YndB with AHSA1/START domain
MNALMNITEIVSRRTFKAPRERVFAAFTDPAQLARWWGPAGSINDFEEFECRSGGAWRFVMRSREGQEFKMEKAFVEVLPLERIVMRHLQPFHRFTMTMTYAEKAGGTELVWKMEFPEPGETPEVRDLILRANEQNFDRLQLLLQGR